MNSIVPYSDSNGQVFYFNGHAITVKMDNQGNPWFDGSEVCKAVGIKNTSDAYARLDDDEKTTLAQIDPEYRQSGSPRVYLSESGLYNLVLRSDKPEAKAFKKFVTAEVLPLIRKTGSYSLQNISPAELILLQAQQLVKVEREMQELHRIQAEQAVQIEATNERITDSEYYTVRQWCQLQRMTGIKYTVMQQWGKRAAALSREREIEIRRVNEGENNVGSYHKSILMEVCVIKPKTDPDQLKLGA